MIEDCTCIVHAKPSPARCAGSAVVNPAQAAGVHEASGHLHALRRAEAWRENGGLQAISSKTGSCNQEYIFVCANTK